ncbi:ATP-binding cassette domain-containing protein [Streptomyces sp. NPDC015532]|uniref:ATP-binding cassette domain-containing protein n=1 Tax=Streptomyces sp. NPDC015532 TaxID=3364960 RepID=UPI003700F72A
MSEILVVTGVDLSYGNQPAVLDAHLSVSVGEVVAITGQSGSGRSSLLYCLAGVLPAARGQVRFEGRALGLVAAQGPGRRVRRTAHRARSAGPLPPRVMPRTPPSSSPPTVPSVPPGVPGSGLRRRRR